MRKYLQAKLHGITVTQADLHYEGSVTIPRDILKSSGLRQHEAVAIWNVTRGTRLETYIIEAETGSRDICINGAAAHLMKPGDIVIIAGYCWLSDEEAADHQPCVLFFDSKNEIKEIRPERKSPHST